MRAHTLLLAALGSAPPAAAWGPEGGFPGTLDIVHNRAQPARHDATEVVHDDLEALPEGEDSEGGEE